MDVEARKPWLLAVALAVGFVTFGAGVGLVLGCRQVGGGGRGQRADGAARGHVRRGLSDSVHSIPWAMPRF